MFLLISVLSAALLGSAKHTGRTVSSYSGNDICGFSWIEVTLIYITELEYKYYFLYFILIIK